MTDHQERPPTVLPTLGEILARVLEGSICLDSFYAGLDCDAALDDRDTDIGFDEGWASLFNQVDAAWKPAGVADAVSGFR